VPYSQDAFKGASLTDTREVANEHGLVTDTHPADLYRAPPATNRSFFGCCSKVPVVEQLCGSLFGNAIADDDARGAMNNQSPYITDPTRAAAHGTMPHASFGTSAQATQAAIRTPATQPLTSTVDPPHMPNDGINYANPFSTSANETLAPAVQPSISPGGVKETVAFPLTSADGRFKAVADNWKRDTHRVRIYQGQNQLTWKDFIALCTNDSNFREFYCDVLAGSPWENFFWECTAAKSINSMDNFEHVTVQAPSFGQANPEDFKEHLSHGGKLAVSFRNNQNDAMLVSVTEIGPRNQYGHIAAFIRGASREQKSALFAELGSILSATITERGTVYCSTDGTGVPWVHLRLDSQPKYYRTAEYK